MTLTDLCLCVVEMTVYGSFAILVVMLLGELLWKLRTPRALVFALWAVVAIRLVCPVALPVPLLPAPVENFVAEMTDFDTSYAGEFQVAVHVPGDTGVFAHVVDAGVAPVKTELGFDAVYYYEDESGAITAARTTRQAYGTTLTVLWMCGVAGMLLYGAIAQTLLRRRLRFAVKEGELYLSDRIASPCVVGVFRPRIYMTFGLTAQQRRYILLHEKQHICHGDMLYKTIGFVILSVHWFNPWAWAAFQYVMTLLERACDERVLRELGEQARQDYSEALLAQSVKRRFASAQPLCFGENDIRDRVRWILRGRRPIRTMAWVASPLCLWAGLCLLGSAAAVGPTPLGATYQVNEVLYEAPMYSVAYTAQTAPQFRITAGYQLDIRTQGEAGWTRLGGLMQTHLAQRDLDAMLDAPFEGWNEVGDIQTVYRTNAHEHSYFVLQMHTGDVLLAVAPVWDERPHIRWLFRLQAVAPEQDDGYVALSLSDAMDYQAPVRIFAQRAMADGTLLVGFTADGQSPGSDTGCALLTYKNGKYELHTWTRFKGGALTGRKINFATLVSPAGKEIGIVLNSDARLHSIRMASRGLDRTQVLEVRQDAPVIPSMTVLEGRLPQTDMTLYYYDAEGNQL